MKKRVVMIYTKKLILAVMLFTILFVIGSSFKYNQVNAISYQDSSSWLGADVGVNTIHDVVYESNYEPFDTIVLDASLIDTNKKYVIETALDLFNLSLVTQGAHGTEYLALDYVLGNNIDYFDALKASFNNLFIPIGITEPFTGTFDGQGYEITNLIFRSVNTESAYNQYMYGLIFYSMFSTTSGSAEIKNLGLINPLIVQALDLGLMTHVSTFVGLNRGLLENVYYQDTREASAGINAEGDFIISGLASVNEGTIRNSYIATPYVKSQSVTQNLTSALIAYQNTGSIYNVYYDQEILLDEDSSQLYGIGKNTAEFQDPSLFTSTWFFQDSYYSLVDDPNEYPQVSVDKTYPILQGLNIDNGELLINSAIDLSYMNQLLTVSGFFRSASYVLNSDIDLKQLSRDNYQAAAVSFNGRFSSRIINGNTLYDHTNTGGSDGYYSIINLTITEVSFIGDYASYSFFAALFGTVEHVNFVNYNINISNMDQVSEVDRIMISGLTGLSNNAVVSDVHLDIDIEVHPNDTQLGKIYIGTLFGYGSADVSYVSSVGSIYAIEVQDTERMTANYVSGLIGYATVLTIKHSANAVNIDGLSYSNTPDNVTYYGGVVAYVEVLESMEKIVNKGIITTHATGLVDKIYVGGIIAYQNHLNISISYIYQNSDIHIGVYGEQEVYVAGFGYLSNQGQTVDIKSISVNAAIVFETSGTLDEITLNNIDIYASNILITNQINGSIKGLFSLHSQSVDLSFIDMYAANLLALDQVNLSVEQSYQTGDINFYTSNTLVNQTVDLSVNVYGSNLSLNHLRQEGDISVDFTQNTASSVLDGNFYLNGLFLEASQNFHVTNGYQGGNINITKNDAYDVSYNLFVSGVGYENRNTNIYTDLSINPQSIDIDTSAGSIDTMLNKGNIIIEGNFDGNIKASGILLYNESILTNAINLGNISIYSDVVNATDEIEASGIVYALISQYAQIRDAANNGDITVANNAIHGMANAAGIAVRNDRLENGNDVSITSGHEFAKIMFSINYGDIKAYSGVNEHSYHIVDETTGKASGIIAIGLLSIVNNINYGNVYSNYLAAGIFGFLYYSKFDTLTPGEVYISNLINYGKVRQVTAYDDATHQFTYNMSSTPGTDLPYAFGAMVGKIHTGTSTWVFAGSVDYPVDAIYFGYLLNFDERINMFASAPPLSSNWENLFTGDLDEANDIISNMVQYMATTNPNDDSAEPFNYFYAGSGWFGSYIGQVIQYYDVSTTEDGMFNELFPFRSVRPANTGTDQYIKDYIEYIPASKTNDAIISRVEADTNYDYPGIYALSSSQGINNGIFIPDSFSFDGLNPYVLDSETPDETWIGTIADSESISYQMYQDMRQIKTGFATTIYDLEIIQTDINGNPLPNGLALSDPVIDQERKLITYYLPSNAQVLGTENADSMQVSRYIEVEDSYIDGARRVPNLLTSDNSVNGYTWVGTHKKVGNDMVEIGPYASTGRYNLTTYDNRSYDSNSRNVPVYDSTYANNSVDAVNRIFTHEPHVRTTFLWWVYWDASGYRVNASYAFGGYGYGPYESFTLSGYPTLYRYVGPNPEPVTYVLSESTSGVTVYPNSGVYFSANTDLETYTISDTSSLEYNGLSYTTAVSIPRSYGVYDSMYDSNGEYIDSVEDHYGSVRVYSEEYNIADPSTYQDYQIRIIRTADESISDMTGLLVNGINALPTNFNVENVTSTRDLHYETVGNNGIINLTYETYNISDLNQLLPFIEVYDYNTGVKVHTSLYRLSGGTVETIGDFDNGTGSWGTGYVDIRLEADDELPFGYYYMELTLLSGDTYRLNFSKIQSANAKVLSITYNDKFIKIDGATSYRSYIDYGLYYILGNDETESVNFTNLASINDVYYSDLETSRPAYLDAIVISNFASIKHIDFNITMIDTYRHQYEIIYYIEAEDGSMSTFTHYIEETPLTVDETDIYKNGGSLSLPLDQVIIYYSESPTIRIEYDLEHVFFDDDSELGVTALFQPLDVGDEAVENVDYFIQTINNVGYEIDFNQSISKGTYDFTLTYQKAGIVNGENLSWNFSFSTITIVKVRNDESLLSNVLFATESVFDEVLDAFMTIIDIDEVTPTEYLSYFDEENPTERVISVLPTTGIDYGSYDDQQAYWVIGQVQETDLTVYMPTFYIPDDASIYRVIDEVNIDYSYQSNVLAADFTDFGTGTALNYVHYRIYAEDFDNNPTHYTDYYIAVQDATNNIKYDITVVNDTNDEIDRVFLMVNVYQYASDYTGEMFFDDIEISMSMFSYYDETTNSYSNNQFETTMYGFYVLFVDLPEGYKAKIEFEQSYITDLVYLESSRIPRRYYVTIHIVKETPDSPNWGYQAIFNYTAPALPLDFNYTYSEGDHFVYNGITWEVLSGDYTYDPSNPPGSGAWQGLRDTSSIYNPSSAYLIGDIIYYEGVYYEAIASNASYAIPIDGLGSSWNEVSEEWLSYNLYTTGDIVFYNDVYYISTQSWNRNWNPEVITWAWNVYIPE